MQRYNMQITITIDNHRKTDRIGFSHYHDKCKGYSLKRLEQLYQSLSILSRNITT